MIASNSQNAPYQYGREITSVLSIAFNESGIKVGDEILPLAGNVEGNGLFALTGNWLKGSFAGELRSYQTRIKFAPSEHLSNGLAVRFRVEGWSIIRYVAVGYTSLEGFEHIKIGNVRQGEWLDFSYGFKDLINNIQNRWTITPEAIVKDLRVYVSGQPSSDCGTIEIESGAAWSEQTAIKHAEPVSNPALAQTIIEYFLVCHPETHEQAQEFLLEGNCPMTGALMLEWGEQEQHPPQLMQTGTFRYLWHACQPAMKLLVYGMEAASLPALCAARDMINGWLDNSFYKCDPDQKYTWYDHGVAERLLCFLLMQQAGLKHHFDRRFMNRLTDAVGAHARLLENEAFYACQQRTRYHNHAWFQDVGLMAAAVSYGKTQTAVYWFECGRKRLQDQINQLVNREAGYAVFIENSSGYHEGIQRLIQFAAQLEQLAQPDVVDSELLHELRAWSAVFIYPDGRLPAHGDTFRSPNPIKLEPATKKIEPQCSTVLLPKSGYFVHKGSSAQCEWFLGLVTTNSTQTHKHEDDTSLVFWLDGIEWLIDPSYYSHDYTNELPAYYRSAEAHNMLSLPGRKYSTVPARGRTSLEYLRDEPHSCLVNATNRSYSGVDIQRQIQCSVALELPSFFVTDSCFLQESIAQQDDQCPEVQVVTFHFGDGVTVRQAPVGPETKATIYELSHPATHRTIELHLPNIAKSAWTNIEKKQASSGLQFMQKIATTMLKLSCPIGTEVKWEIHVC